MKALPKTWERFILYIYIGGLLFSVGALILTIYELYTWESVYEANAISNYLFNEFGILGGSALILGINLFLLGIFFIFKRNLKNVEKSKFKDFITLFGWPAFEGIGFAYCVNSFLDMLGNIFLACSLARNGTGNATFSPNLLKEIFYLIFIIIFVVSILSRTFRYVRNKKQT